MRLRGKPKGQLCPVHGCSMWGTTTSLGFIEAKNAIARVCTKHALMFARGSNLVIDDDDAGRVLFRREKADER